MRTLVVFEDPGVRAFEILTAVRGVFELRCGARTLLDRLVGAARPERLALVVRPELQPLLNEVHGAAPVPTGRNGVSNGTLGDQVVGPVALTAPGGASAPGDEYVWVNGRFLALGQDLDRLLDLGTGARRDRNFAVFSGGSLLLARCGRGDVERLVAHLGSCLQAGAAEATEAFLRRALPHWALERSTQPPAALRDGSVLLEHAWELVQHNAAALADDFAQGPGADLPPGARIDSGVHALYPLGIRIAAGVRIRPGVVLDAEEGPITIESGTEIQPNAVIRGPVHIGPRCLIKAGAKIHGPTSLGPVCKIGGEVEGSIVQGWSNKQHDGFLGHAFLAEWVNLGADTNNSDLKNNYGRVRMWEAGEFVDTGLLSVGLIAADHVKSAINTQFNTGTVVGLASQVAVSGFPPKYIPPFSWCGAQGIETYAYDRALETARTVMARRQRELTPAYAALLRLAYTRATQGRSPAD